MSTSAWQRFNFISGADVAEEGTSSDEGWIQWFCSLEGHEYLCEVDYDYVRDSFNLYGLKSKVKNFDRAMEMVLGIELPDGGDLMESETMDVFRSATDLYGLVHSRFIISPKGLSLMNEKFVEGRFGYCPRVYCKEQRVLPVGPSDQAKIHRVRMYCPSCQECYDTGCRLDGSFFGTSFPAIFLQAYPTWVPLTPPVPFVPKIFGFRVHKKKSIVQVKIDKGEYGWQTAKELGSGTRLEECSGAGRAASDRSQETKAEKPSNCKPAQNERM